MKKLLATFLALCLLLLCACGMSEDEVNQLCQEHYNLGFEAGKAEGYTQGEADGYSEGKSDGYDEGYDDGHSEGYDEGYIKGEAAGYSDGWDRGKASNSGNYITGGTSNNSYYIGNLKTHKFHSPHCSYLPSEGNRTYFYSRSDAINSGYSPCGHCNP